MSTQIKKNGNWVTVAGGTRMWVGTKAALQAALDAGELVDGTAVMVTDDYEDMSEYIRNQNILSDLEAITISTSSESPTVIPYDGFIYIRYASAASTPGIYYLNGIDVIHFEGNYATAMSGATLAVKKGDTVNVLFNGGGSPSAQARFYKLRDYSKR